MTMTKAAHTPGPWTLSESHVPGYARRVSIVGPKYELCIATMDGAGSINPRVLVEVEADAYLIAAAPDLLAALHEVKGLLDGKPEWNPHESMTYRNLCAAIARAEGGAS